MCASVKPCVLVQIVFAHALHPQALVFLPAPPPQPDPLPRDTHPTGPGQHLLLPGGHQLLPRGHVRQGGGGGGGPAGGLRPAHRCAAGVGAGPCAALQPAAHGRIRRGSEVCALVTPQPTCFIPHTVCGVRLTWLRRSMLVLVAHLRRSSTAVVHQLPCFPVAPQAAPARPRLHAPRPGSHRRRLRRLQPLRPAPLSRAVRPGGAAGTRARPNGKIITSGITFTSWRYSRPPQRRRWHPR